MNIRNDDATARPSVLFVCVKNGGKSQMAAGLMRELVGDAVDVRSAGTKPRSGINELSAESLLEVGVDITAEVPRAITEDMIRAADVVGTPPLNHWPRSPQLRSRPG